MRRLDLVGQRFGRLLVIEFAGAVNRKTVWHCQCDCGKIVAVKTGHLRGENSTSCGCFKTTLLRNSRLVHGETGTRPTRRATKEYEAWRNMVQRCEDPNHISYKYYGARGVQVCERWRQSYPAFLADMGRKPSPEFSLDRIDNDGHYEPGNVRWATAKQQANNRRMRTHDQRY